MKNALRMILLTALGLSVLQTASAQQTPSTQFRFAFFASGEVPDLVFTGFAGDVPIVLRLGLTTGFTFVNPGAEDVEVRIRFIGLDGAELDIPLVLAPATEPLFVPAAVPALGFPMTAPRQSVPRFGEEPLANPFTLQPGASLTAFADVRELDSLAAGTIRIESDSPVASIQLLSNFLSTEDPIFGVPLVIAPFPPVVVSPAEPVSRFRIAAAHNQLVSSGVSLTIAEEGRESVSGTLRLLTTGGVQVASTAVEVTREAQFVQKFEDLFPGVPFSDGTLVGEFDGELLVGSVAFSSFGLLDRANLIVGQ